MPVTVQCNELEVGMRLYEPLIVGDQVLIPSGKVLTEADVASLRRRFADAAFRVTNPVLDEAIAFEDTSSDEEIAISVSQRIRESMDSMQESILRKSALDAGKLSAISDSIREVLAYLDRHPVSVVLLSKTLGESDVLPEHTASVSYTSLVLAYAAWDYIGKMRVAENQAQGQKPTPETDLLSLGLGAIFMNCGLVSLRELLKHQGPLTNDQWEDVREHPLVSAQMLPDEFDPEAKRIVKAHHENAKGTGYPNGLSPEKIPVLARVLRIADGYETAKSGQFSDEGGTPIRALWQMTRGPFRDFYDPKLIEAFSRLIQPFPIGAKIRLEDGRAAVVTAFNRENPFEPIGIVAFDKADRQISKEALKPPAPLGPTSQVRLKSFQGEDLLFLYERASTRAPETPCKRNLTLFRAFYP